MKIIATLLKPTSGRVSVMGLDVTTKPDSVRRIIGYVPQDLSADDELTGIENVMLQARLYGISRSDARRRALELLEMIGLSDAANRIVRSYSGGTRRRLELAMGLINNPELLILDEPTLGLDVQSRLALWDYIKMLKKENGLTIIITTHYMDEADKLSDMVAIIDHGRIVVEGSPEELKSRIGGDVIMVKISRASQEIIDRIRVVDDVLNVDLVKNIIRFTTMWSGMSIVFDRRLGYLNRFLVTPIPRFSIVLSKILSSVTRALIQATALLIIALGLGLTLKSGVSALDIAILYAVIASLALSFSSIFTAVAIRITSHDLVISIANLVNLPLMFTSNAMFPIDQMPQYLQIVAKANPITHANIITRYYLLGIGGSRKRRYIFNISSDIHAHIYSDRCNSIEKA